MRKNSVVLLVFLMFCCISCEDPVQRPEYSGSQETVINFLRNEKNEYYHCTTELKRKDFIDGYKIRFYELLDSIGFLTNWEGEIKDIRRQDYVSTIEVKFKIEIPIEAKNGTLELRCTHLLQKSEKETDPVYQGLCELYNGADVVFSGFPRTIGQEGLYWGEYYSYDELCVSYPDLHFWVSYISSKYDAKKLSNEFIEASNLVWESGKLIELSHRGKISRTDFKKRSEELKKRNLDAAAKLTEEEKAYLQIVTNDAYYNEAYKK